VEAEQTLMADIRLGTVASALSCHLHMKFCKLYHEFFSTH